MRWRIAFGACCWCVLLFAVAGLPWRHPYYSPMALLDGTAHRPFAYRVLAPFLLRALMALGLPALHAAVWLSTGMLAAFVVALKWLARGLGLEISLAQLSLAIAGLLLLMLKITHLYDLPTLVLWTASLGAMAHRRQALYLALFTLGCLNRETALLLAVVDVVTFGPTRRAASQLIIYTAIRAVLMVVMAARPGEVLEIHIAEQLPAMSADIERTMLYTILALVAAGFVARGFPEKPRLLRVAALVTVPALAAAYAVAGYPFEFRVFYEAYPAVGLLALWPVKGHSEP